MFHQRCYPIFNFFHRPDITDQTCIYIEPNYKDRKCAVNENSSVCIESAWSKSSNNGPLRNGSAVSIARLYIDSNIVCFYDSDHAFKTVWRRPCSCHLIKIKACFLKPDRPAFIIVINTSCSGVCYRIYARQKFFTNALAPDGALALFGIFAGVPRNPPRRKSSPPRGGGGGRMF